ncbi:MAG: cell envelope integrity protein CreD [Bacteroidales bacterium]
MKIEISNHGKWQLSLTLKLVILAFMGLVLLIPLEMVKSVILERQGNAERVKKEISTQWAGEQCISGPVLNLPVRYLPAGKDEKPFISIWHILPESLDITVSLAPEQRYRGIYKSVVYSSAIRLTGSYSIPGLNSDEKNEILWQDAYYTIGVSDNRGLKGDLVLKTDSSELKAEPGVIDSDISASGVSFRSPLAPDTKKVSFSADLNLSGSETLRMIPLGKITKTSVKSTWSSPSFTGSFLPSKREVTESGFSAEWEVTHLNRNFPQAWSGKAYDPSESAYGVQLFLPVDHYQKSWRSARYGILFIALTFLVLIFLEVTRKENIHILNYFLVSLALILFFSLLNALSEHTGFSIAYLLSSAATITMITLFTARLFRAGRTALTVAGMLIVLYSFIFVLLTLNDYALLAGNVGLFILLAVIMRLASKLGLSENNPPVDPGQHGL